MLGLVLQRGCVGVVLAWAAFAVPAAAQEPESPPPPPAAEREQPPPEAEPAQTTPRERGGRDVPPATKIAEAVPDETWLGLAGLALLALLSAAWSVAAGIRARRLRRQRESASPGGRAAADRPAPVGSSPTSRPRSRTGRRAAQRQGGDFYDAFALSGGRAGLILGDVHEHGREALARTTFVRYMLRAYLEAGFEPRQVLKVGSEALADHLDDGLATVTVAVLEPATGRFTYASAGHPPPVVVGPGEPFEPVIACSAPPFGLGEPTGFRQSTFTLTAGSRVCLYTDGVTEARVGGRMLGVAQLERALAALPPGAGANHVLDAIEATADEITDDMAVCLVAAPDDAPAAGPRVEELEVDEHDVGDSLERFLRACGVALEDVPGILREAGEAARREGSATVRVRANDFRPGVDVVPGNLVRLAERRRAVR